MQFQWYPGHMTKAKRMMQENIKLDRYCDRTGGCENSIRKQESRYRPAGTEQIQTDFIKQDGFCRQQEDRTLGNSILKTEDSLSGKSIPKREPESKLSRVLSWRRAEKRSSGTGRGELRTGRSAP